MGRLAKDLGEQLPPYNPDDAKHSARSEKPETSSFAVPITLRQYASGQWSTTGLCRPYTPSFVQSREDLACVYDSITFEAFVKQLWSKISMRFPAFVKAGHTSNYCLGFGGMYKDESGFDMSLFCVTSENFDAFILELRSKHVLRTSRIHVSFFPRSSIVRAHKTPSQLFREKVPSPELFDEKCPAATKHHKCVVM